MATISEFKRLAPLSRWRWGLSLWSAAPLPLLAGTTAAGVLALTISVLIDAPSVDQAWLASGFSVWFWLALVLFAIGAVLASLRHPWLAAYNLALLLVGTWLVPIVIGGSVPDAYHTYEDFGYAHQIAETGVIDLGRYPRLTWPAWAVLGASLALTSGQDGDWIIRWAPFFIQGIAALTFASLLLSDGGGKEAGRRFIALALLVFIIGNWGFVASYQGHVLAYALLSVIVAFAGRRWLERDTRLGLPEVALLGTLAVGIVVTHLFTSIAAAAAVTVLMWRERLFRVVAIAGFAIIGAWALVWGFDFWRSYLADNIQYAFSFPQAIWNTVFRPLVAGQEFSRITQPRTYYNFAFMGMAIVGFAAWMAHGKPTRLGKLMLLLGVAYILLTPLNTASASAYVARLFVFSLPPMAYFIAYLAHWRRAAMVGVLLFTAVALPAHVWLRWGLQDFEYLFPSYLSGLESFHERTAEGTVAEFNPREPAGDPFPYGAYRNRDQYTFIPQLGAKPDHAQYLADVSVSDPPGYLIETRLAGLVYVEQLRQPDPLPATREWLRRESRFDIVYDSDGVRVWMTASNARLLALSPSS